MPLFDVARSRAHAAQHVRAADAACAGLFGLVGLLLTGVGLYGVIFHAPQRAQIGLRMALGAGATGDGSLSRRLRLAAVGIAAGLALAFGAGRLVAGQLRRVGADPSAFRDGALLAAVAIFACVLPARRASGLNPITALRRD